jgi:D,D-heptose 1,7-bisphosphate phosphatase
LNVDTGYVHRPEDWQFTDRAPEALRDLRAAGYAIALVTNQSGIARGYFTRECVRTLHRFVQQQLAEHGAALDAIAICPHGPDDGCACRKPRTGMVQQIEEQLGEPIAYERSWTIGDKISDLQFGRALGTRVALLRSGYWHEDHQNAAAVVIADSLYQAAQAILAQDARRSA